MAVSTAIDRAQIVDVSQNGYAQAADVTGLAPRYGQWASDESTTESDWTAYDPDAAKALFDDAGLVVGDNGWRTLPDGSVWEPTIITGSSSTNQVASAQIIVESLKAVGVNAAVRALDWGAVTSQAQQGDFDMAHMWTSDGVSPYNFYRGAMSTETLVPVGEQANENFARFGDERADELLAELAAATELEDQKAAVSGLEDLFVELAPIVPIYYGPEWAEFNTQRFVGFPDEGNFYADPNTRSQTAAIVLTTVRPRS